MIADDVSREVAACEALEGVPHVARQRRGGRRLGMRDEGGGVLADEAARDAVPGLSGDIHRGPSEEGALTHGERREARFAPHVLGGLRRLVWGHLRGQEK